MVKWYKTYLEVYGKSFDEISDDSIRKVKRQLKERQNDSPLVSVVLIAHNEERHLISCIWSLSENHCHFPIEIIAVNNNSTDKTEEVLKSLGVTYYNETKKGPGYARQCGLIRYAATIMSKYLSLSSAFISLLLNLCRLSAIIMLFTRTA